MWDIVKGVLGAIFDLLKIVFATLLEWFLALLGVFFDAWLTLLQEHPWIYLSVGVGVILFYFLIRRILRWRGWKPKHWLQYPAVFCFLIYLVMTLAGGLYFAYMAPSLPSPEFTTRIPSWPFIEGQ